MASSVSGVNSSAVSSIYGNRNVLSGLASGLDTESMIENAVSGIKTKIASLQKKRTTVEWQQESYRSIIDKMVQFSNKYTSYSSGTNLMSPSFFNKAVITTANGENADCVSATGKTNSNVEITSITQLATAARYTVDTNYMTGSTDTVPTILANKAINLSDPMTLSNLNGDLTLNYGNKTVSISFSELETYEDANQLKTAIEDKLGEEKIVTSTGDYAEASDYIGVSIQDGTISFSDKKNAGNSVYMSDASKEIQTTLGITVGGENKPDSFTVDSAKLTNEDGNVGSYLEGKELTMTLDGVTKKITLPGAENFVADLQTAVKNAFGDGKITVSDNNGADEGLQLKFELQQEGSMLEISSPVEKTLGLGQGETSYLNASKTLQDLNSNLLDGLTSVGTDSDGNSLYAFTLNGKEIGQYTKDTALETILMDINSNAEAGVNVSFSKITNQFVFTAKETGAGRDITFGDGLAKTMFGDPEATSTAGVDAKFAVKINEKEVSLTRSSNTVDLDGLSVTLKESFTGEAGQSVTFTSKSDSDQIVDAIKNMVKDYNEMMNEVRDQYSTLPAKTASKKRYEPLTDEEKASMSESAIESYEKKAKQGLLFGDSDLSSLYDKMRSAITPSGADGANLRKMGISTSYSQGNTTLKLDENKLRTMLESNPDMVRDAFTKVQGQGGSSTNGLMQNMKTQLDRYSSVMGAVKGVLVQKAGTKHSSLSLLKNTLLDKMKDIDTQIQKYQGKLSSQVDLYSRQFTQLEVLVNQMNSQSSMLGGLMG